jgi:cation diffusion facilitator CzcD-associated flavoprotein CzcO
MGRRREEQLAENTGAAVIGAGPAGLAVGACLRQAGVDFVILEKEDRLAPAWRRHYERLRLHTVKRYSALPFLPFPRDYPRYVPRDLMIEYLDSYAARFALQPRLGEAAHSVRREGEEWTVETASSSLRAPFVVIASGVNAEPVIPSIPGAESFAGKALHAVDYVNAAPFAGQSVLVVGLGNTGAEIALDLTEAGARPTISVRNGVHIVPRDFFGFPIQVVGMLATKVLPGRLNDAMFPKILDPYLGNLSTYGIKRPRRGITEKVDGAAKIPVIDVGTVRKIHEGAIKIAPAIVALTAHGAVFAGGNRENFDAVIFATGYRPSYPNFLRVGDRSNGQALRKDNADSGLYFVGFRNSLTGLLREISIEAMRVAAQIRARRRS